MSLDVNKILEHARKHDELIERMKSENRQRIRSHTQPDSESMASHYHSKFYQRALEQEQTRAEMEEAKAELK